MDHNNLSHCLIISITIIKLEIGTAGSHCIGAVTCTSGCDCRIDCIEPRITVVRIIVVAFLAVLVDTACSYSDEICVDVC